MQTVSFKEGRFPWNISGFPLLNHHLFGSTFLNGWSQGDHLRGLPCLTFHHLLRAQNSCFSVAISWPEWMCFANTFSWRQNSQRTPLNILDIYIDWSSPQSREHLRVVEKFHPSKIVLIDRKHSEDFWATVTYNLFINLCWPAHGWIWKSKLDVCWSHQIFFSHDLWLMRIKARSSVFKNLCVMRREVTTKKRKPIWNPKILVLKMSCLFQSDEFQVRKFQLLVFGCVCGKHAQ